MADDSPRFERAKLYPLDGQEVDTQGGIDVMFNPSTLKIQINNTMKSEAGAGGGRDRAAQFVDKSSTTLALELLFDTTLPFHGSPDLKLEANDDVRIVTEKIASAFLRPGAREGDGLSAPRRVQFAWGAFLFNGMITSYSETLDFFAPEGIPLRATVSLTITEDQFQFLREESAKAGARPQPSFTAPASEPLPNTLQNQAKDPRDWRDAALFNGLESPRLRGAAEGSLELGVRGQVTLPALAPPPSSTQRGFSFGASTRVGTHIPGAFPSFRGR